MSSLGDKERQAVMRFVTSCSRAPLGGFQHLNPPLTLHKVLQLRRFVLIWHYSQYKHCMHVFSEAKLERHVHVSTSSVQEPCVLIYPK